MLSYIQDLILTNLLNTKDPARYSEIQVDTVDNDLFNYHLQQLVKRNYVLKEDKLYSLSNKGKEYVHKLDVKGHLHDLFKVSVLAYVTNSAGELLLQKRLRHPYFGEIGVVAGKMLLGESAEDAAKRKLLEETGLTCNFRLVGVIRKTRKDTEDKIIEDTLFHVCYGDDFSGELVEENDYGLNYWASFDKALDSFKRNATFGTYSEEVLERIRDRRLDTFYFHESLELLDF
ncbi:NUDIX domain-containing protein [candidate division WWE3 bacterium]|nr:NUDIX domain-containing protein [candidate division WWE3 bacterium]